MVAVVCPNGRLCVAWCGDARAYLLHDGRAERLTEDHNMRRVDGGSRHRLTSCLGADASDAEMRDRFDHPAVEGIELPVPPKGGRLLLASDGAYEPHEEAGHNLYALLSEDSPQSNLVSRFVQAAVKTARKQLPDDRHHMVDNATALLADLSH